MREGGREREKEGETESAHEGGRERERETHILYTRTHTHMHTHTHARTFSYISFISRLPVFFFFAVFYSNYSIFCGYYCSRGAHLFKTEEGLAASVERRLLPPARADFGSSPKKPPTISSSAPDGLLPPRELGVMPPLDLGVCKTPKKKSTPRN